jgi:tetrahydromethanopterin S-methyltransferase subunit G
VWVRSAAIRPVPSYALLPEEALGAVEQWLGSDEAETEQRLHEAFERFERTQPALAQRVGRSLGRSKDEVALALGYFLSLVIWLGFEQAFGSRLAELSGTAVDSAEQSLKLDEQLRGQDPVEAVDSDDVVAMEQPHAVEFIHEHVEAALEAHAGQVDVDAVHGIYRVLLIELLALSHAVAAPADFVGTGNEICA